MNAQHDLEGQQLDQLRNEFTGHRIWRSVRSDGHLGDWVASLHDPSAGTDPTVVCSSADALRETLRREAQRVAAREAYRR